MLLDSYPFHIPSPRRAAAALPAPAVFPNE